MRASGGFRSYSGRLEEDRIPGVSRPSISGEIVFTEREDGLTASPPFRILCYVGRKTGEAIAPRPCLRFSRTLDPMMNASDKGYNAGRLAFRRYFAKYGPNVKQNDPRMPPNPYVGYYGVLWLNGFESELRRHVAFSPSTGRFGDIEEPPRLR